MAGRSSVGKSELTLPVAIDYYSGGQVRISEKDDKWKNLGRRLREGGYTPFEYLHYAVHYYDPCKLNWKRLQYKNLLVGTKCWKAFKAWKSERKEEIQCIAKLQYEKAESYASMGYDRTRILMEDFYTASALARVEMALYWESEGHTIDCERVVTKFAITAGELALGSPEWLEVAPLFRQFAELQQEFPHMEEEQWMWTLLYLTMQRTAKTK